MRVTYISVIVFPNPYQKPPAPTRLDNRTLRASALSALRTLGPKAVGMLKSAQSLVMLLTGKEGVKWCNKRVDENVCEPDRNLSLGKSGDLREGS